MTPVYLYKPYTYQTLHVPKSYQILKLCSQVFSCHSFWFARHIRSEHYCSLNPTTGQNTLPSASFYAPTLCGPLTGRTVLWWPCACVPRHMPFGTSRPCNVYIPCATKSRHIPSRTIRTSSVCSQQTIIRLDLSLNKMLATGVSAHHCADELKCWCVRTHSWQQHLIVQHHTVGHVTIGCYHQQ